jgi:hypothetical protein
MVFSLSYLIKVVNLFDDLICQAVEFVQASAQFIATGAGVTIMSDRAVVLVVVLG